MKLAGPGIAMLLLAAGCAPQNNQRDDGENVAVLGDIPVPESLPPQSSATPESPARSIAGHWRVAAINDEDIGARNSHAITVEASGSELTMTSQCIRLRFVYTLDHGAFSARRWDYGKDAEPGAPPPASCARGLSPDEAAFEKAILGATRAYHLPSNALVINGPQGSVTLFTQ